MIGAILAAAGLAGPVFALIEQPRVGWSSAEVFLPALLGVLLLACFVVWESRAPSPMLPLELFRARNFSAGNLETLALYGGLGAFFVYLVVFLQQVAGYSPLRSGLATLPTTVVMFSLSRWFGRLADRFGVRWFMGCGPLVASAGLLMLTGLGQRVSYFADLLPGIVVFSVGLAATVAPLTAGVLSGADPSRGGIASAVNNTLARVGGLLATAAIGAVISAQFSASLHSRLPAHLPPTARQAVAVALRQPLGIPQPGRGANAVVLDLRRAGQGAAVQAFHSGLEIIAGLVFLAGLLGLLGIRDRSTTTRAAECAGGAITDATAHGVPLRSAPAPGAG